MWMTLKPVSDAALTSANAGDAVAAHMAAVMTRCFMERVSNNRFHFRHVELVSATFSQ
jgi:hypothetical protein